MMELAPTLEKLEQVLRKGTKLIHRVKRGKGEESNVQRSTSNFQH
jgi:hypothetical protein